MSNFGRVFLGVALLAGAASSASAQQVTDWTGFYASVFAGYALDPQQAGSSSTTIPPTPSGGYVISGVSTSANTRIDGVFGGVGAGYNYQVNQFVLGVDGAVHIGGLYKGTSSLEQYTAYDAVDTASIRIASNLKVNVDWYSTFAGTLGVAFDEGWLVSVKGGLAVANVSSSATANLDFATTNPAFPGGVPFAPGSTSNSASSSQLVMGPTIGLGVAKKLSQNVSVGVEYAYVGLPTVNAPQPALIFGAGGGSTPVDMGFHTLKGSLKYHF